MVNTYGCTDEYIFSIKLYLLSILAHAYDIIMYYSIGPPGHGKVIIGGMNSIEKYNNINKYRKITWNKSLLK